MSLFETPTPLTEAELLEQCPLKGRKSELKQLIKALTLCKTGQGKAILITGNEGIGKTALLDAFRTMAQTHLSAPVIYLKAQPQWTPRLLYTQIVAGILEQAQEILKVALAEANRVLEPLDMRWTEADLVRMVAMTHLQETSYGRSTADMSALAETIKRAIPFFRRMALPVQEQLDQLGRLLVHPWVVLAASLLNPLNPAMQNAKDLLDPTYQSTQSTIPLLGGASTADSGDDWEGASPAETATLDKLVAAMVDLLGTINRGLQQQSALVLVVDQWERLSGAPEAVMADLKTFWVEVLRQTTDQRDFRLMAVLSCRSEAESYVLGGGIYNAFRLKYLVSPLTSVQLGKTLKAWAQAENLTLSDEVMQTLIALSRGNAAWLDLAWRALAPEFAAGILSPEKLVTRYGADSPAPFVELLFTRVQLDFIGEETRLARLLGRLIQQVGAQAFDKPRLVAMGSGVVDASDDWYQRFLNAMVQNGLMHTLPDNGHYQLAGAFVLAWLQNRIRPVQEDLPSQDKLASLKTVLPLAIQSDELTREKLFEMVSMASALEDPDMLTFVESTMVTAALSAETPQSARLVVLDGLAILATPRALETLVTLILDENSVIQQAVCAHWVTVSRLPQARRFESDVWTQMQPLLNAPEADLRQAAWQWLAHTDSLATPVLKALRDAAEHADPSIRLAAYAGLQKRQDTDKSWLETLQAQLRAETDPTMAKAILKALSPFPSDKISTLLQTVLQGQPAPAVYADILNALIQLDWRASLPWVSEQLKPNAPIEQRLSVLRKLGQQPGYEAETILINHLNNPNLPAEERWMAIRSLGWAGITRRALTALEAQQTAYAQNDIVAHSLEVALKQLSSRLASLPPELTPPSTSPSAPTETRPNGIKPPSWYQPSRAQSDNAVIELIPANPDPSPEGFPH